MSDLDKELELVMSQESKKTPLAEREDGELSELMKAMQQGSEDFVDYSPDSLTEEEERRLRQEALIKSEDVLTPSKVVQVEIEEGEEKFDNDDVEAELQMLMGTKKEIRDFDLSKDLPNVERIKLEEFILIEGQYTTLFIEYIQNNRYVPEGTVPLCIQAEGKEVFVRNIQATPDVIYNMKYFLHGFDFYLVKGNEKSELDIYTYLGKIPILKGVEGDDITGTN